VDPWIAAALFVVTYVFIATERIDRTLAALAGGIGMILLGVIDQSEAFAAIDLEVILLLASMMVLAGLLGRTGLFQWLAIRAIRAVGPSPARLLVILAAVTAGLSATLDNVTTIVLIAPVTLYVAAVLRVSPIPFLISQILASNIGGASTLIGDPPNILIASASGFGFDDFLLNVGPPVLVIFGLFVLAAPRLFRADLADARPDVEALERLDADEVITDRPLLHRGVVILVLTVIGFVLGAMVGIEPATVALLGATALLIVSRTDPAIALREVEWATIAFFAGLFMLVEGIVATGIVEGAADRLVELTGGDQTLTTIGLLWFSGFASGIVDNIPYTATMLPVVDALGKAGLATDPLWWSLSLGACLGGNATLIGASANVVTAGMAARADTPIAFDRFARLGIPVTVASLAVCTVYLWLRYLV
jgi:Na+/H+ antiporter NhaD/arsenite permease-like protein